MLEKESLCALPALIVFDWDHTLVSTPMPLCDDHVEQNMGYYKGVLGDDHVKAIDSSMLCAGLPITKQPKEGGGYCLKWCRNRNAHELLEWLYSRGVCMAIASNKDKHMLNIEVDLLGWRPYFSAVLGTGDVYAPKPAPDLLHAVMRFCGGVDSERLWFVGDTLVDMAAATAAKCCAIHYKYNTGTKYDAVYDKHRAVYESEVLRAGHYIRIHRTISDLMELVELYDMSARHACS